MAGLLIFTLLFMNIRKPFEWNWNFISVYLNFTDALLLLSFFFSSPCLHAQYALMSPELQTCPSHAPLWHLRPATEILRRSQLMAFCCLQVAASLPLTSCSHGLIVKRLPSLLPQRNQVWVIYHFIGYILLHSCTLRKVYIDSADRVPPWCIAGIVLGFVVECRATLPTSVYLWF